MDHASPPATAPVDAAAGRDQPPATLTAAQLESLARELDAIRARVMADLGERDRRYIRRVVAASRGAGVAGRALLFAGWLPPAWLAGTGLLALSWILENMEVGHNVMHGQYDFLDEPALQGKTYEWDFPMPSEHWRHTHNDIHHVFTNVVGKDRDVGFGFLRVSADQPWQSWHRHQLFWALVLGLAFDLGVAVHDLELEFPREQRRADYEEAKREVLRKIARVAGRDYLLFPVLAGPSFLPVLLGNLSASAIRNLWSFAVIFCGHFPEGVTMFDESALAGESRGAWYVRQMQGSANITGGRLLHLLTGNLSHQIEHHLYPDMPAHRYGEIAGEVRAVCQRHGVPYHAGTLRQQVGAVVRRLVRFAKPPAGAPA
jgi:NADPH-dependent stearoyl-CoA 9-desaturase